MHNNEVRNNEIFTRLVLLHAPA